MAFISPEDGYLTVMNLFDTDSFASQERLLPVMEDIINNADYPGWISSTLHSAFDRPGTANYIQWRSLADLQDRYSGRTFRHETVPLFKELATGIHLIKTEVVSSHLHPELKGKVEISPKRDDLTVIVVFTVEPENQAALVKELSQPDEWLTSVPGYRSHCILRDIEGTRVLNYAQWESKALYDAYHTMPEESRPKDNQAMRQRARSLVTSRLANTYAVTHTRSATDTQAG